MFVRVEINIEIDLNCVWRDSTEANAFDISPN